MARRFLRNVRVVVADTTFENLMIRFSLRREASATPAEGSIDIFNLGAASEQRVRERGEEIRLEAGYGGSFAVIFSGDVRRVERHREDLDRITRIHVGGHVARQVVSIFMRSYEGDVAVRTIVADAVAAMGFESGPLDAIPVVAVETDFRWNGPTGPLLSKLLSPWGVQWFEEDGVVRFTAQGASGDDRLRGVLISEGTGMIGTPTVTDEGLRVETQLDARLRLDTRFRVESVVLTDDRVYKVVQVVHRGDNREGQFSTSVEGRPVETGAAVGASTVLAP